MKNVLIVKYTPRNDRSRTKELLDYYIENKTNNKKVEILDLITETPEFFLEDSINSYYKRNYAWEKLSSEEQKTLEKFDKFTKQFKNADTVVLAYPMYNFSMPAIVKAYFDMILQKWETWDITKDWYVWLQTDKKIILITTSWWKYEWIEWYDFLEHNIKLVKVIAWFIWAKLEIIDGGWTMIDEDKVLTESKKKIDMLD